MLEYVSLDNLEQFRDSHYVLHVSPSHNIAIIKSKSIGRINTSLYSHPIKCEWCTNPWIYFNKCIRCDTNVQYVCPTHRNMNWCVLCMDTLYS